MMDPGYYSSNYSSQTSFIVGSASQNDNLVQNPIVIKKRGVTVGVYCIAMCTAPIYMITYSVLLAKLTEVVDFTEAGNWWTFLVFLITTLVVFLMSFVLIWLHQTKKLLITWKVAAGCNILMAVCLLAVNMVCIGAMEQFQDRSQCNRPEVKCTKHSAPTVPSTFGIYVQKVCGTWSNYTSSYSAKDSYEKATGMTLEPNVHFGREQTSNDDGSVKIEPIPDPIKCEGAKWLKRIIFGMYSWAIEILLLALIEAWFGMGGRWNKNLQEYVERTN